MVHAKPSSPQPPNGTWPGMLEREAQLARLHELAREAASGQGRLVFVGGEMGIGKTTLVEQFRAQQTRTPAFTILSCDGIRLHGPLGPLFDIAHTLGPDVERLLHTDAPRERVFRAVVAALAAAPGLAILVGEDVHWADEASLDLLYYLGRRIGNLPTLFIATYRNDEVAAGHPLRRVLGDLATSSGVRRMELPPLSPEAVARLAEGSALDPGELYAFTGGNPFIVREIVESGTPHPITLQDATLSRASRLSPGARSILEMASIVSPSIEPDLLQEVVGRPVTGDLDACLEAGLLRTTETGTRFRHAAVREAILHTIPPMRRLTLHRQALAVLESHPRFRNDHALLAYQAEEAANGASAFAYAFAAAQHAARYRSHREAAAQYDRARRHCPPLPVERRIDLLERCAYEHYLSGHAGQAVVLQTDAVERRRQQPASPLLGNSLRELSRYHWSNGDTGSAMELAREALATLEPYPDSREFARACSNYSQLCMLSHDREEAIRWGSRAMTLASELGDTATLVHAMINVGSTNMEYEGEPGSTLVQRARELAAAENLEDDVARAYINLAWDACWSGARELGQQWVEDGLAYTDAHDLMMMHLYLQAIQAQMFVSAANWDGAAQAARRVLQHPTAVPVAQVVALVALGLSRVRQGDVAGDALDRALELATPTLEFQRLGPVRAARAEAAWLADDPRAAAAEAAAAIDLARERPHPWFTGALAMWLWRAGEGWPAIDDQVIAVPYRLLRTGEWRAAAAAWRERENPVEEGRALACSTEETDLRAALELFDRIGARPDAARVAQRLRALGFRQIPRGPRPATRAAYAMLTPRELEVLSLLADNATNAEIAQRLFLSRRTVEHHVSAILAKLEVPTRDEAAVRARDAGLTPG